jgi:NTP pyrophosphatase (non-canonical NTP hydrolase)
MSRYLKEIQHEVEVDSKVFFAATSEDIAHHVLALCGEVGELANILKKVQRGDLDLEDEDTYYAMAGEITDIFIYTLSIAGIAGMDMEVFYAAKREYNCRRFAGDVGG